MLIGSAFQLFLIPLFGALSDRVGRRPVYLAGAIGAAVWAFAFFPLIDTASWWAIVLAAIGGLVFHALMYGPQAAFIAELSRRACATAAPRWATSSPGILGGALAPIIATALLAASGSSLAVSLYVAGALAITVIALYFAKETAGTDLDEREPAVGRRFVRDESRVTGVR